MFNILALRWHLVLAEKRIALVLGGVRVAALFVTCPEQTQHRNILRISSQRHD